MIITVKAGGNAERVERELVKHGLWVSKLADHDRIQFEVKKHSQSVSSDTLRRINDVEMVTERVSKHPLVDAHPATVVVKDVQIGAGARPILMAGPCSVESEAQIMAVAARIARVGGRFLRGGAFKPRTSPYSFRGRGAEALRWMRKAADLNGLLMVTEALGTDDVPAVAETADMLQIGSRNMQNFPLLEAAGRARVPILLKRGMSATVDEWLNAGEYCLLYGAPSVVFCERGVRGFDNTSRNLLDLNAVALLSKVHGLPVIVDPSHASGRRDLVPHLARAGMAVGAHGLIVETHDAPGMALSDGPQALTPDGLEALVRSLPEWRFPIEERRAEVRSAI